MFYSTSCTRYSRDKTKWTKFLHNIKKIETSETRTLKDMVDRKNEERYSIITNIIMMMMLMMIIIIIIRAQWVRER